MCQIRGCDRGESRTQVRHGRCQVYFLRDHHRRRCPSPVAVSLQRTYVNSDATRVVGVISSQSFQQTRRVPRSTLQFVSESLTVSRIASLRYVLNCTVLAFRCHFTPGQSEVAPEIVVSGCRISGLLSVRVKFVASGPVLDTGALNICESNCLSTDGPSSFS